MGDRIRLGRVDAGGGVPDVFSLPAPGHGLVHVLSSGVTGSGKSSTQAAVLGHLAGREDTAFVGVDLKGGLELLPWRPRFTEVARKVDQTEDLLGRCLDLFEDRCDLVIAVSEASGSTIREWQPAMGSRLVIVVDEMARLVGSKDALAALTEISAVGRALGIHIYGSTQYALKKEFGAGLLVNMSARICHRMSADIEYATALGISAAEYRGFLEDHFTPILPEEAGVCYVNNVPGMDKFARCKAAYVSDGQIDARVRATKHLRWDPQQVFRVPPVEWVLEQDRLAG